MLATKRLLLRRLDEADAAAYLALISDTEAMRFVSSGRPPTAPEAAQSISAINARYEKDGFGVVGIEHRAEARLIGRVGFWVWDRTNWTGGHTWCELRDRAEIELGWALVRDTWGHGFATEAAAAMRDHAFRELGLTRLISLIHPENNRSLRVAHRLGAVHEADIETARWGPALLFVHKGPVANAQPLTV